MKLPEIRREDLDKRLTAIYEGHLSKFLEANREKLETGRAVCYDGVKGHSVVEHSNWLCTQLVQNGYHAKLETDYRDGAWIEIQA